MLIPVTTLFLRWLGQWSWWIPMIIVVLFLASFREVRYARFNWICTLAICQCAFVTLYAVYATFVFESELLH